MAYNVLVTGGSRGIGRQIALQFAQKGNNIIITYNKTKELSENFVAELQNNFNIKAFCKKVNMSNLSEIDQLVEFATNKLGNIDILVNNAGICIDKELYDRTVSQFVETFKINLFSVFELSKKIGERMYQNKFGKIINISSNNSINCFYPTTIDYDASKSALNSLTRNLAIQFAPYVNVNAVAPGWIDTDMNKEVLTPDVAELEVQRILKRRIGKPSDVANLVEFLCSDKAEYINGEIIVIDGGMF